MTATTVAATATAVLGIFAPLLVAVLTRYRWPLVFRSPENALPFPSSALVIYEGCKGDGSRDQGDQ